MMTESSGFRRDDLLDVKFVLESGCESVGVGYVKEQETINHCKGGESNESTCNMLQ